MSIPSSSVTVETPLIDLARVTTPEQLQGSDLSPITEFKNSQEITRDYEHGLIVHVYDVTGGPAEAIDDPRIGGSQTGSIHPWAVEKSEYAHHFLQRHTFKHLVRSNSEQERLTRVTSVYKQTPCPNLYSMEIRSALRSVQEWHAKERPDNHPAPWDGSLSGTQSPVAIPQVRPVVVKRYRKVKMKILGGGSIMELAKKVGKTNGEKWMGEDLRTWLFEGLHARMIYGTPLGDGTGVYTEGWFELTLFFEADVERLHEWWRPLVGNDGSPRPGLPVLWEQGASRASLHLRKVVYPIYKGDFDKLVPLPNEDGCIPSEGK